MINKIKINNKLRCAALTLIASLILQLNVMAKTNQTDTTSHGDQLVLSIKFKVSPENAAKFKTVLTNLFDTISHEKNFVSANLHEAIGKPGEFLVYEIWNDNVQHFLTVQMKSPYAVAFEKTLIEMNVDREPSAYAMFGQWTKK
ncbi:putative quinol monooxygenase [Mucilaginibacter aquariorum]|uniref:Antibiotic biosynthesis monooxygenase n=1 Tax=Mucilaginibacter aquariorum TaxID=2967225 RepID=A0ABT1SXG0_9SPHI|nr:antibiotic biosynthesis monooxygenase family protein [Mucilaginibacter aquariorum]MCQ6957040.1 antibiotic biosynthesis monooxygenase [Mucilaginibacter aquariorum]